MIETKQIIVLQTNGNDGPCNLLGQLVRETKTQYVYRRGYGPDAFISKRFVHLEPCRSCPDHGHSHFPHLAARL